jgi:hypothetical protein
MGFFFVKEGIYVFYTAILTRKKWILLAVDVLFLSFTNTRRPGRVLLSLLLCQWI